MVSKQWCTYHTMRSYQEMDPIIANLVSKLPHKNGFDGDWSFAYRDDVVFAENYYRVSDGKCAKNISFTAKIIKQDESYYVENVMLNRLDISADLEQDTYLKDILWRIIQDKLFVSQDPSDDLGEVDVMKILYDKQEEW